MPSLGRFASADTLVPNAVDPQAWNRYSYVRNNPLIYNDPSGHCWGFASGMRDWTFLNYGTTCSNMDMAWNIVTHPNATLGERAGAGAYLAAEGGAHVGVAAGSVVVAAEVVGPVVAAGKTLLKTVLVYANMAYQAATAAYPTTTAVVGGVAETAAECAMTGGGCTTLDYVVGGATAGVAHRISTPTASQRINPSIDFIAGDSGIVPVPKNLPHPSASSHEISNALGPSWQTPNTTRVNWFNPQSKASLGVDNHAPFGPHYDFDWRKNPSNKGWRIFPNGDVLPK